MIKVKATYSNRLFECKDIYSDKGLKILDKKNGAVYNWSEERPVAIASSRLNDYEETDEPIEPIETLKQ